MYGIHLQMNIGRALRKLAARVKVASNIAAPVYGLDSFTGRSRFTMAGDVEHFEIMLSRAIRGGWGVLP